MSKQIREYHVGTIFGEEELDAIRRVLESGESLTRGRDVELFEEEFAEYCSAKYAIAVSSCGAALHIATQLLNLGPNDEIICQVNAFWVTIVHLLERNVQIKCADIDPDTLNIDPDDIEHHITDKTKAIYIMHHGGNPADLDPIRAVASKYGLVVVEDCAHVVGATYKGRKIGQDSDIACFSFSTMKNISTLGEGGMLVTNNKTFADMAWGLRTNYPYGEKRKRKRPKLGEYHKPSSPAFMHAGDAWDYDWNEVNEFGSTYRMSTPQAAVGRVQLKKLESLNAQRGRIAKRYNKAIEEFGCYRKIKVLPNCKHTWHLFTFFIKNNLKKNRDEFINILEKDYNIFIANRFWPIHLGGIMRMNGHRVGECPVCERVWFNEQMSLPISPQMEDYEVEIICTAIEEIAQKLIN